nr:MAG TPA: hypothetical protein [Caudoviricetes sp.]DAS08425.1 MAG TPA: hypothetical protein [Caudoviricetes sp.]
MFKKRQEVEEWIYTFLDKLDPTEQNSQFYKAKFAKMNDTAFLAFMKQYFPIKFQIKIFEVEPSIKQIANALKYINVPMVEKMRIPFEYKNKEGIPVMSEDAVVIYSPVKKMKQFISKKNSMSTNITNRNMRDGLLLAVDKNGNTTDREMEALAVMSLDHTMKELSTYRADSMDAKNKFYSIINNKGMVLQSEVDVDTADSLARNTLNVYFLGAGLNSNLINEGSMLRYTAKNKQRKTIRQ